MNKMFRKRFLRIGVLETNEILKTKDLPKTLLASQLKTVSIYKVYYKIKQITSHSRLWESKPRLYFVSFISVRVA